MAVGAWKNHSVALRVSVWPLTNEHFPAASLAAEVPCWGAQLVNQVHYEAASMGVGDPTGPDNPPRC